MNSKKVVEKLELMLGLDGGPVSIQLAVEQVLVDSFLLPPIQAAEKAEGLVLRIARMVEENVRLHHEQGTISTLCILGSSQDTIAGSCYVLQNDSIDIRQAKRNRVSAGKLHQAIRSLTFNEFEKFGAKVLQELGAQKVKVTPQSNDQGIDFYGVLNLGALQQAPLGFFKLAHEVEIRFAGQAKHYPDRSVGSAAIRELVGAISLARYKSYSSMRGSELFEEFGLKPFNPLLALLFTTGEVTSGARSLGGNAGVIVKSGSQIAVFLADKGVGMASGENNEVVFDEDAFNSWLS